ncbi:molecular chaperone [Metapseudomonas resinovorans]|uniref:Putative type 1 pili assembly chaperone n=1 Tax=Metapseudomonas resinovorans NBRC 106553 TaxID=1245471 RepID=S6AQP4_METRE|nr:molecular chaperone [Pseudomonas resinovorans]BAN46161.1 putative type 1 pili assembly chaperone [Pseudomonas resinovorans NBRC 106553]
MEFKNTSKLVLGGFLLLASGLASAAITLSGTRVILQAPAKEASIIVKNPTTDDLMIQSWLESESADGKDVPFAITPPLSRLNGNKQQALRILFYGEGLPTDKESLFRLNVQEIPQKAKDDNTLQIALRQRIKFFYRPAGLQGKPEDAPQALKWRLVNQGGQSSLEVSNPTAYHVSLGSVRLVSGGRNHSVEADDLVAPGKSQRFAVKGLSGSAAGAKVEFESINDYGGNDKHSSDLAP